jgi:hypothetical protein
MAGGDHRIALGLVEVGIDDDRHRYHRPEGFGDVVDLHAAPSVLRVRLEKAEIAHLKRVERADDKAECFEFVAVIHAVQVT